MLERVQHRATRLIPSLRKIIYEKRLKALDLTTLTERRQRDDMIQLYKIFNGKDTIEIMNLAIKIIKQEDTALNTIKKSQSKRIVKILFSTDQ